jgi:hypothetical protein
MNLFSPTHNLIVTPFYSGDEGVRILNLPDDYRLNARGRDRGEDRGRDRDRGRETNEDAAQETVAELSLSVSGVSNSHYHNDSNHDSSNNATLLRSQTSPWGSMEFDLDSTASLNSPGIAPSFDKTKRLAFVSYLCCCWVLRLLILV